ncbi:TMEM255A [Branchiostoma lanceolatum]|uniref:TMEM255A protein n=1 Tax=Branchiostoma lanceolatum TaxID=7740 RepID=A0A8J9Z203_BRALA|nr:TMEM255A [Branchiostoma lanceolatum]
MTKMKKKDKKGKKSIPEAGPLLPQQQEQQQQQQQTNRTLSDATFRCKEYVTKQKRAVQLCVVTLLVALASFAVGLRAYFVTDNVKVGAFWPGIVMAGGMLVLGLGAVMAVMGTVVDGVVAGLVAKTDFSMCSHVNGPTGYVTCGEAGYWTFGKCDMLVHHRTCYCCHLYAQHHCDLPGYSLAFQPHRYDNVDSCRQVEVEFQALLWASVVLNILALAVAVTTIILISAFKSSSIHPMITAPPGVNPATPVVIYNGSGQQHVLTYAHCPPYPGLPTQPPAYTNGEGQDRPGNEKPPPYSL